MYEQGWIHSRQLEIIEFLREENRVLREQLGGRRCDSSMTGKAERPMDPGCQDGQGLAAPRLWGTRTVASASTRSTIAFADIVRL
jgi:hypothetical protein